MPVYKEQSVTLRFVTPAFLGGAETSSELRTPPFKSLLRRWWRIVEVGGRLPDVDALREKEGRLFGHAWLKDNGTAWASKSHVRLAIEGWPEGTMTAWPPDPQVWHREVQEQGRKIGSHLYLGYGPLTYVRERGAGGATGFNPQARTSAFKEQFEFKVAVRAPGDRWAELHLDEVLTLWAWFGTIGSRSRNGWGSLEVVNRPALGDADVEALKRFSRPFAECFDSDWPHAIGRDEKGLLVWRTRQDYAAWSDAMKALAAAKIAFRTTFPFVTNRDIGNPVVEKRHILAYPVTNHGVLEWSERDAKNQPIPDRHGRLKQTSRLANQLWFKIQPKPTPQGRRYEGIVVHLPHRFPKILLDELQAPSSRSAMRGWEQDVWTEVHRILDVELERCP
jgi:CRISPR-associated protein Cmr1